MGTRFGYAIEPDGARFPSWTEMIEDLHGRTVDRLRDVVRVYAAVFGSMFLREMAQKYNREEEPVVDPTAEARPVARIDALL